MVCLVWCSIFHHPTMIQASVPTTKQAADRLAEFGQLASWLGQIYGDLKSVRCIKPNLIMLSSSIRAHRLNFKWSQPTGQHALNIFTGKGIQTSIRVRIYIQILLIPLNYDQSRLVSQKYCNFKKKKQKTIFISWGNLVKLLFLTQNRILRDKVDGNFLVKR